MKFDTLKHTGEECAVARCVGCHIPVSRLLHSQHQAAISVFSKADSATYGTHLASTFMYTTKTITKSGVLITQVQFNEIYYWPITRKTLRVIVIKLCNIPKKKRKEKKSRATVNFFYYCLWTWDYFACPRVRTKVLKSWKGREFCNLLFKTMKKIENFQVLVWKSG